MPTETEHKYLVKKELWQAVTPGKSMEIRQGYLLTDPEKTIRVRTKGNTGYITVKGKAAGASRLEFEYEIPVEDAKEMIAKFCSNVIEKTRHIITHNNKTWEVDEFAGDNTGLIVAEIELTHENETYSLPEWAGENVTDDHRYANSNLSTNPFCKW